MTHVICRICIFSWEFPGLELGFNLGFKLGWQTGDEGLTFKSMFNTWDLSRFLWFLTDHVFLSWFTCTRFSALISVPSEIMNLAIFENIENLDKNWIIWCSTYGPGRVIDFDWPAMMCGSLIKVLINENFHFFLFQFSFFRNIFLDKISNNLKFHKNLEASIANDDPIRAWLD